MIATDDTKQILSELGQFTGTTRYHKSSFGRLRLTDGAHYLRERLGCYWLIDIVESYQPQLASVPFQLWSINVRPNKSALVEMREDSGLAAIVSQEIPYTDFKLKQYEWYCVDGVVMLKSEY